MTSFSLSAYWGYKLGSYKGYQTVTNFYDLKEEYETNYSNSRYASKIDIVDFEIATSIPTIDVYFMSPDGSQDGKFDNLYIVVMHQGTDGLGLYQYTYDWQ